MDSANTEKIAARTNPDWRRIALIVLCLVGIGVSGYLGWTKLANVTVQCMGIGGCEEVNASRWGSIILPIGPAPGLVIPTALLGTAMYVTLLALTLVPFVAALGRLHSLAGQAAFGVAFAGVLYSAYLTYVEIFLIKEICPWCVTSAVTVTLICILCYPRQSQDAEEG
jgi:uncharacterized membrane protein